MEENLPEIYINGLRILEPMTALTNILVSLTGWVMAYLLVKRLKGNEEAQLWAKFFTWVGAGTFLGAYAHASGMDWFRIVAWTPSGIGLFYVQKSLLSWLERDKVKRQFEVFIKWQLVVYLLANLLFGIAFVNSDTMKITSLFFITMADIAIGLLFSVATVHFWRYKKTAGVGHLWIVLSVMLLLSSAIVHVMKLGFHEHLNHKDIGHVLMALTMIGLGTGVLKLHGDQTFDGALKPVSGS